MSKNKTREDICKIEHFIFNDDVQNLLGEILGTVKNINIFEITGMSSYETKHSNTLSWLFENSNKELSKSIFEGFLKETIKITKNNIENDYPFENIKSLNGLLKYIYLPEKDRDIEIYREKNNIDLLIVDNSNRFTFTIENKVHHSESDGQLKKYREYIEKKYISFNNYFIFLTLDESWPKKTAIEGEKNRKTFLLSNYSAITNPISNILKEDKFKSKLGNEERLILEHYLDMLIRKNIVSNEKLSSLCNNVWSNYGEALNILISHKPSGLDKFKTKLFEAIESSIALESEPFYNYSNTLSDRRINTQSLKKIHLDNKKNNYIDEPEVFFGIYIVKSDMRIWFYRKDENTFKEIWASIGGKKGKTKFNPYEISGQNREQITEFANEEIINEEVNKIVEKIIEIDKKLSSF